MPDPTLNPSDLPEPSLGWIKQDGTATTSYSALTAHRKCPAAWYYQHSLGLTRDSSVASPERDFGIWYGALRSAEALERGRAKESLLGKPGRFRIMDDMEKVDTATLTTREVRVMARQWWKTQTTEAKDLWVEKLGEELPERLDSVFVRWRDQYGEAAKREAPIGVEIFWKRQLPLGEVAEWDTLNDPTPVSLLGYIDEIYFDEGKGLYVARDNKTSKTLQASTSVDDMLDSQLQLYTWGVAPLLQQLGIKNGVRAVSYDRARSTKQALPRLTATGTLSKAASAYDRRTYLEWARTDTRPWDAAIEEAITDPEGEADEKEFAALVKMRDELPAGQFWGKLGEFYKTGKKAGEPKFGVYEVDDSELARITSPDHVSQFFQRTLTPVSQHVVRSHLQAAVDTARDILRTELRSKNTGEAPRNFNRQGCSWCDFAKLCRAQMIGGARGDYELAEFDLRAKNGRTHV